MTCKPNKGRKAAFCPSTRATWATLHPDCFWRTSQGAQKVRDHKDVNDDICVARACVPKCKWHPVAYSEIGAKIQTTLFKTNSPKQNTSHDNYKYVN